MSSKRITLVGLFVLTIVIVVLTSCSTDPLTAPKDQSAGLSINQGIPADQINWISWKPEVKEQIDALAKSGLAGKMITHSGGTVGGNITFGNTVEIPAGAVQSNTYITVEVLHVDGNEYGAEVEFLPSMVFSSDVLVTLSWAYLDVENISDLNVYYSEDGGETWFLVEDADIDIDYENKTLSVWVNHFTRYGWGL
ncbi:MAG: hypothetical protein KAT41_06335 [Candidatus Marinimicrobia bacterium]|nr:hypothetical protein [Candidatus Neomarinimicrobiota bacterium]